MLKSFISQLRLINLVSYGHGHKNLQLLQMFYLKKAGKLRFETKNSDWKSGRAEFITYLPETVMNEVLKKLTSLL